MYTIVCEDCGQTCIGRNEHEAEIKWSSHVCPMDDGVLDSLPLDVLRDLAYGRITRDQAIAQAQKGQTEHG